METQKKADAKSVAERLLSVDVSGHTEKKGKHTYLSWPFAVAELIKVDPAATFGAVRFPLPSNPTVLVPWMETPLGFFVEVAVTVGGVTRSQIHPVLNAQNAPIKTPTTFEINTSIQRALVKAIALHGLGLNVYAGEDLPLLGDEDGEEQPPAPKAPEAPKVQPNGARTPQQVRLAIDMMKMLGIEDAKHGEFMNLLAEGADLKLASTMTHVLRLLSDRVAEKEGRA
jgi:hypothetical protein